MSDIKENMVELLDDSSVIFPPDDTVERLADHLIANGVTIKARLQSNADRIRAMSDAELAALLIDLAYMGKDPWTGPFSAQFCDVCPTVEGVLDDGRVLHLHECEFADGKCPHGGDAEWWLRQPYQTEDS